MSKLYFWKKGESCKKMSHVNFTVEEAVKQTEGGCQTYREDANLPKGVTATPW